MGVHLQLLHLFHLIQHLMHIEFGHEEFQTAVSVSLTAKEEKRLSIAWEFIRTRLSNNSSELNFFILVLRNVLKKMKPNMNADYFKSSDVCSRPHTEYICYIASA